MKSQGMIDEVVSEQKRLFNHEELKFMNKNLK